MSAMPPADEAGDMPEPAEEETVPQMLARARRQLREREEAIARGYTLVPREEIVPDAGSATYTPTTSELRTPSTESTYRERRPKGADVLITHGADDDADQGKAHGKGNRGPRAPIRAL